METTEAEQTDQQSTANENGISNHLTSWSTLNLLSVDLSQLMDLVTGGSDNSED